MRGILLKGTGLRLLWQETLVLVGFSVGLIGLSVVRFRESVE